MIGVVNRCERYSTDMILVCRVRPPFGNNSGYRVWLRYSVKASQDTGTLSPVRNYHHTKCDATNTSQRK